MGTYYEVRRPGNRWFKLKAKNSTDAKRKYCKLFGLKASDPWIGMSNLTARKVKEVNHDI